MDVYYILPLSSEFLDPIVGTTIENLQIAISHTSTPLGAFCYLVPASFPPNSGIYRAFFESQNKYAAFLTLCKIRMKVHLRPPSSSEHILLRFRLGKEVFLAIAQLECIRRPKDQLVSRKKRRR